MATILLILSQNNFRDEELRDTKKALENNGKQVTIASETTEIATGMFGLRAKPDITFSEALRRVSEFRAVVVIGGSGVVKLINNPFVNQILQRANQENKIIAAICWGPRVLAAAGLLAEKQFTANCPGLDSPVAQEIAAKGGVWSNEKIVTDGRIITAFGPDYATAFGQAIAKKLDEYI